MFCSHFDRCDRLWISTCREFRVSFFQKLLYLSHFNFDSNSDEPKSGTQVSKSLITSCNASWWTVLLRIQQEKSSVAWFMLCLFAAASIVLSGEDEAPFSSNGSNDQILTKIRRTVTIHRSNSRVLKGNWSEIQRFCFTRTPRHLPLFRSDEWSQGLRRMRLVQEMWNPSSVRKRLRTVLQQQLSESRRFDASSIAWDFWMIAVDQLLSIWRHESRWTETLTQPSDSDDEFKAMQMIEMDEKDEGMATRCCVPDCASDAYFSNLQGLLQRAPSNF